MRLPKIERNKPYIYRILEYLKSEVDKQIEEMFSLDLKEESDGDIPYPVVSVRKKDGKIRIGIDFKSFNAVTKADDFPLENVTVIMYEKDKSNAITTLDLLKGYLSIPMEEASRDFTSFKTHREQYRFKVMPFDNGNAAATFQRVMNKALAEFRKFSRAYIDDIVFYSYIWKLHIHIPRLDDILSRLEELGFIVNLSKCSFSKSKMRYRDHNIASGKHERDPEKNGGS